MEVVHLTLLCCRHALVVVRHEWSRLAQDGDAASWRQVLRARARSKVNV